MELYLSASAPNNNNNNMLYHKACLVVNNSSIGGRVASSDGRLLNRTFPTIAANLCLRSRVCVHLIAEGE